MPYTMVVDTFSCAQVDFKGGRRSFSDGAGADTMAIMPLLRRGVKNLIIGVPTQHAVSLNYTEYSASEAGKS